VDLKKDFGDYQNVRVLNMDFGCPEAFRVLPADEPVDTVLSLNVLEHIRDDREALRNCFRALAPGGRLVLLTPAHAALYSAMDQNLGHHRRYGGLELERLVTEAGFHKVDWRYLNALGALGWFINGRLFRRRLLPSHQVRGFDWLIGWMKMESRLKLPFGLSVLLTAEKPSN
jgi:SAM-dependent methyltransferase